MYRAVVGKTAWTHNILSSFEDDRGPLRLLAAEIKSPA